MTSASTDEPATAPTPDANTGRDRTAPLVVGARASALSLWQTHYVLDRLHQRAPHATFRIEEISTHGDRTQAVGTPLTQLGDKSIFVAELERALLHGELDITISPMNDHALVAAERARPAPAPAPIDAAVHSLKDLPGRLDHRLTLAAIPEREDPRDALVSRHSLTLHQLPPGAIVATGSLRRRAQLLALRPDLRIVEIRGNVDTRLRKALAADGPDAVIFALAGLKRLGLEHHIIEALPVATFVPAVGQGALAVETRAADHHLRRLLKQIDHPPTRRAITAERAVLATFGGGCQVPLGAHATLSADGATLHLIAVVASLDGARLIRVERDGPATRPTALGRAVAHELLHAGADAILHDILGPTLGPTTITP